MDYQLILRRNIAVLAKRAVLDPDACMKPKYGTPEMRVYKQADGLARGEFKMAGNAVVCSTCGGNCGQCGVTGTTDDAPASMGHIVASLGKPREAVILKEGMAATYGEFFRKMRVPLLLSIPFWLVVALLLAGCVSTGPVLPDRPYCATCIGPYDVTLRSHRQGLGLPE